MNSHLEPEVELLARIDVATICASLAISVGGASRHDVHLFAYLSSMAHSQMGFAPSSWGYQFAASKQGLPFSDALDFATDCMLFDGELTETNQGFQLFDPFLSRFEVIAQGQSFGRRVALIRDVCNVVVFRALPSISRAVRNEPQLSRSASVGVVRLIDEGELGKTLMALMLKVRNRLPAEFSPSAPAMLWLDEWEQQQIDDMEQQYAG